MSKHAHPDYPWLSWSGDQMRCERCGSICTHWTHGCYLPQQVRGHERQTEAFVERHSRCEVGT